VLSRWGDEGVDIVYSTDNGFQDHMLRAAEAYPNTLWVTMSDLSTTNDLPNVAAYTVDWCQVGFAQGVAAGLVSEANTIGAVGAIPILPATKTDLGLRFGAELASPGTQVVRQDSGDFIDAAKAQEVASALIDGGADVIVAITHGGTSPQIAARTQEAGKLYVGAFADETQYAPEATVTSAVLDFSQGYQTVAQQRLDDAFEPGIFRKGIADGFIKLTPFAAGYEEEQTAAQGFIDQLTAGEVTIPDDCTNATE
jgi:basic membrane lipoprotein Med (substrate-binding protein (PBP1-ABC) superfamily)